MPSRVIQEPPRLVLTHKGVAIYETYRDDDAEQPEQYVFSTNAARTNPSHPRCFDVRDWPELVSVQKMTSDRPALVDYSTARKRGLELEDYTRTPEYLAARVEWDRWWDVTLPGLIRQALIEAIDQGTIK